MKGALSACFLFSADMPLEMLQKPHTGHFTHQCNSGCGSMQAMWQSEHTSIHPLSHGVE